jgi:inosine-uridine nucleoside N-ribohydrolase
MSKLHLDVDPGCDDAIMIALALMDPAVEVVGMSTVGGNSTVENTTHNALAILELFDRTDVPVARGADAPINGSFQTAEWVHGPDGLRGDLPEPTTGTVDRHGAAFIVEQARTHGDDLTIAAVAPMTNLATALVLEPALPEMVDDIYLMGGAALSAGNATPMAEANFYNDAIAARRVVQSTEPKLVGLEATYQATLPYDWTETDAEAGQARTAIGDWLDFPEEVRTLSATEDDPAIHDAAPVAHCIGEGVLTFEPYYLDVDTTGGPSHGTVICDERRNTENDPNAEVAVSTDTQRFRSVVESAFERL